ncbi:MAG: hypothetical protein R2730_06845 [Chitinophagales bacterium]
MRASISIVLLLICNLCLAQFQFTLTPNQVTINTYEKFELTLQNTQDTIPVGTMFKVLTPKCLMSFVYPVFSNISASTNGNATIKIQSMNTANWILPPIWPHDGHPYVISYEVRNNPVLPGETISFKYGNDIIKIKIFNKSGNDFFKIAQVKDGQWYEIGKVGYYAQASNFSTIDAYLPSTIKTGEPGKLKLVALDVFNNKVPDHTKSYQLEIDDPTAVYPDIIHFNASDSGYIEVPVTFNSEGFYHCKVTLYDETNPNPPAPYNSNYVWVQDDPAYNIYWGDMHSHSDMSRDALGHKPFEYAKYTTCLDFYANSEHVDGYGIDTFGIDSMEWEYIKDMVVEHHDVGSFETILAFEATFHANNGGNHIAYFNLDDAFIDDVKTMSTDVAPNVWALWQQLDSLPDHIKALAWAHFTGEVFFSNTNNPTKLVGEQFYSPYRTLYELYSTHGQSEYYNRQHGLTGEHTCFWFAQDALAEGEKVGFTSFSDNHNAKPGQKGNGLGAAIAPELTRNELFHSFANRLTYGSTGERILLEFKVNDQMMGSEINLLFNEVPHFELMAHGTRNIEFVELVKWDFNNPQYGDDVHPDFTTIKRWDVNDLIIDTTFIDSTFTSNSVYYLRLKQVDDGGSLESWAWSSPVWVNGETILAFENNTIIEDFVIYPNLVSNQTSSTIQIGINALQSTKMHLLVYDILAREVYRDKQTIVRGNNLLSLSTSSYSSGRYFIAIEDDNGNKMGVRSFVVQ